MLLNQYSSLQYVVTSGTSDDLVTLFCECLGVYDEKCSFPLLCGSGIFCYITSSVTLGMSLTLLYNTWKET